MTMFSPDKGQGSVNSEVDQKFESENARLTPEHVRMQEFMSNHINKYDKGTLIKVLSENSTLSKSEIESMHTAAVANRPVGPSRFNKAISDTKIGKVLSDIHKKYLSAKKGLPSEIVQFKELMHGTVLTQTETARNIGRAIERQMKIDKVKPDEITTYLTNPAARDKSGLSDKMILLLNSARNHIDLLSETLIKEGYVEGKAADSITDNIGVYLNRSYEIFSNKEYKPTDEVKQKAKAYIYNEYLDMYHESFFFKYPESSYADFEAYVDKLAERKVNDLITKPGQSFVGVKNTGSKDAGLLMEKKDIPAPIRALYGEITDPVQNYVNTAYRVSNLVETNRFLHNIKQLGEGRYFFLKDDPRRPVDFNYQIAGETSPTMFPMNGMYTTKEVYDGLKEIEQRHVSWAQWLVNINGAINWSKTVGSYVTHSRNVIGNIPFIVANGYDPRTIDQAMKGAFMDAGIFHKNRLGVPVSLSDRNKRIADIVTKLKDNNVIGQNIALGVVKDIVGSSNIPNAVFERTKGRKRNLRESVISTGVWVKNGLDRLYSMEDDIFKIMSFINESNRYAKAMFSRSYKNLTAAEQLQVDQVAMEITKNVLPNYSKLGSFAKLMSRNPLFGNFIAFQAEAIRVTGNTISQMNKELRSENPKIRKIGRNRMVGIGFSVIGRAAIVGYVGNLSGSGAQGMIGAIIDDEEEKKIQKAVREFCWPWMKKDDLLIQKAEGGKISVMSLSSTDPHGIFNKSINAALYEEDTKQVVLTLAQQWGEAFMSETIFLNYMMGVINNQDSYGDKVYEETDTPSEAVMKLLKYTMSTVGPTSFSSAYKVYSSENSLMTIAGQLSGMNPYEIDVERQLSFKVDDFGNMQRGTKAAIRRSAYQEIRDGRDYDEVVAEAQLKYESELDKISKLFEYADVLGVDININMLKNIRGLTNAERLYLLNGQNYPKLNIKRLD